MLQLISRLQIGREYCIRKERMEICQEVANRWGISRSTLYDVVQRLVDPREIRGWQAEKESLRRQVQKLRQDCQRFQTELHRLWQKERVRGYLLSPNLLTFARQIQQTLELCEISIPGLPDGSFSLAVVRSWARAHKALRADSPLQSFRDLLVLRAAQKTSADFADAVQMIGQELSHALRASSSVEAINSVLRPVQQIKKTFPTDFAHLLALHHNMRPFSEGPRKGKTPFEILGVPLRFNDWIELIRRIA